MRRFVAALCIAAAVVLVDARTASAEPCTEQRDVNGRPIIVCDDSGGGPSVTPVRDGPEVPPVPQWNVVFGPGSEYCIDRTGWMDLTGLGPAEIENLRAFADNTLDTMIAVGFVPCADVDAPLTPTAWVLQYIRAIPLPVPAPEIEPGQMLVGLEAFLETGSTRTHVIDDTSPFGAVHVGLTSEVRVDWDDGSVTEWTTAPDGPYPDGELTHVWTRQGAYDVGVTQRWVATWSVGTQAGVVRDGLTTEGALPDFPVEEVEAVVVE